MTPRPGEPPYWEDRKVDLEGHRSVLDGILDVKAREDGSIGIRCSCQAAICGSCGVRVNGQAALACNTKLRDAQKRGEDGAIVVEPMGNMPVLKDLIVEHGRGALEEGPARRAVAAARGRPAGARVRRARRVDDRRHAVDGLHPLRRVRLGLPLDGGRPAVHRAGRAREGLPLRRRPARRRRPRSACATSPRTRTGSTTARTASCCVEVCPKGVAPMDQIMRLRRRATHDYEINDPNNGRRHEQAFTKIIRKKGILDERKLLQDSFGPFRPQGRSRASARPAHRPARIRARQDHAEEGAVPREARGRREPAPHLRPRREPRARS